MLRYLTQRIRHGLLVLVAVSLIVFISIHLAPGDPALIMSPNLGGTVADQEVLATIRKQMGLDRPLYVQYLAFVGNVLQGSFGMSLQAHIPVAKMIGERLPATLELAVLSMLLAVAVAVPLGIAAAWRQGSAADMLGRVFTLVGVSTPPFWVGLMLIILFSVHWQMLPSGGREGWSSYILPTVTLALQQLALISRLVRTHLLEELGKDYVRTARAKGVTQRRVVYAHALRNSLIPVVTVVGLQFGALLGGAVITESVFGWPGLGRLLLDSVLNRDYPVVQATVFIFSAMFVVLNLAVDLCYLKLNPRIRYT